MRPWGQVYTAVYGRRGAVERGVHTFGAKPEELITGNYGSTGRADGANKNLRSWMGAVTNRCPSRSTVLRSLPGSSFSTFVMYCSYAGCPAGRGKSTNRV